MAQGERAARVAEQIQREAARIFLEKADDPVLRAATVTAVRVSADLRHARILFAVAVELREEAERRDSSTRCVWRRSSGRSGPGGRRTTLPIRPSRSRR